MAFKKKEAPMSSLARPGFAAMADKSDKKHGATKKKLPPFFGKKK